MSKYGAVVLAAGRSTRMKSHTPKVLHRVCGREMVGMVVDAARSTGLDPTVVVVSPGTRAVKESLGDMVKYAEQEEPGGTGHAILQARSALQGVENVVVLLGDMPLIRPETLDEMKQLHEERGACATVLTAARDDPNGFGRIVRSSDGSVSGIVEEADVDAETVAINEVNTGACCFRSGWLWDTLPNVPPSSSGEVYATDLIAVAARQGERVETLSTRDADEALGVNSRVDLSKVSAAMQRRLRERWMLAGVSMPDPSSVYIDFDVVIGEDTVILPNTHVTGRSKVGRGCRIGPNSIVSDSTIADGCEVVASMVEESTMEEGVSVGPFSHIRPGSRLERGVRIGNFAEVKNSRIGAGAKSGHFSFIGDADIGADVNIGAGTVTVNYDGREKHRTTVGDGAFIGCDTMLIAPVTVGERSDTGAGAVVRDDIPPDSRAVGVPARLIPRAGEGRE
jgi:bifunctional UDP-N-acetylglucosamine pyrophosphorylase/glucosamine-1-phosphate N-acetyltransferase